MVGMLGVGGTAHAAVPFERPARAVEEMVEYRTPTARTWELRSGQRVTQVAAQPVQWQDRARRWHHFDLGLRPASGGWIGSAGSTRVFVPGVHGGETPGAVTLSLDDGLDVRMKLRSDVAVGETSGSTSLYRDVWPGADLRLQVTSSGVKEDVVLHAPSAAARTIEYEMAVTDADVLLEKRPDGGMTLRGSRSAEVVFPPPAAIDAAGAASTGRFSVSAIAPGKWRVTSEIAPAWMTDPSRSWPITVDPTANVVTRRAVKSQECWILRSDGNPYIRDVCGTNDATDRAVGGGWRGNGTSVPFPASNRGWFGVWMMRFLDVLPLVSSDSIESATLRLYRTGSNIVLPPSGSMSVGDVAVRPSNAAASGDQASVAPGPTGYVTADVTSIAQKWQLHSQSSGTSGYPAEGLQLSVLNSTRYCAVDRCDWTSFAAPANADVAKQPLYELRSWPTAPAGSVVLAPSEGRLASRFVPLQAKALHSSVSGVRFQYVAGSGSRWVDIPEAALRSTDRRPLGTTLVPVTGPVGDRRSELVVWDLGATPNGDLDGPIRVRAFLESTQLGQGGITEHVNFRVDRAGVARTATAPIGPGDLNLANGKFSMTVEDVSFRAFLQDLTVSRTYASRGSSPRTTDMFGPGWQASVDPEGATLPFKSIYSFARPHEEVIARERTGDYDWEQYQNDFVDCLLMAETDEAAAACSDLRPTYYEDEQQYDIKRWVYRYVVVEMADGQRATFLQRNPEGGDPGGWEADEHLPGHVLQEGAADAQGRTSFTIRDPGGGIATFVSAIRSSPYHPIVSFQQPGSATALTYTYEPDGTRSRLKRVTAPYPTGGTPRWVEFQWTGSGRAARVSGIAVGSGASGGTTVMRYGYDARGRLVQAYDPRVSPTLVEAYDYNDRGLLSRVDPAGEAAWQLDYARQAGDLGERLVSVSRAHPDGRVATETVRYDVPVDGAGAPHDMSIAATASWGQVDDLPWEAVAIFPGDDSEGPSRADYSKATVHYLDLEGREVNVAEPGGHISTAEYDANGNVIRELTATNRARALAEGGDTARRALDLSTVMSYSRDGVMLEATYGPRRRIVLRDGTAVTGRVLTATHHDEGVPSTGGPYRLPTSVHRAVEVAPGERYDQRILTRYEYDGLGGMSGWMARRATRVIADPGGQALASYSILHPTYPVVEESRRPRAAAGGARPDVRFYQYAGITPSSRVPAALRTSTVCESGTPSGFLCMDSEGTAPEASVPRRWYGYDALLGITTGIWESRSLTKTGAPARHTATRLDAAGRVTSVAVNGGLGELVPVTTYTYSPTTGRQVTASAPGRGTITQAYDTNGRLQQYTDASGLTTRYTYDLRGRLAQTVEDGNRTVRYGYDERDNLTSVSDPDLPGPITATHDPDGSLLSETLPNGLQAAYAYDEEGAPSSRIWSKTTDCSSDCVRVRSEIDGRDADGRITGERTAGTRSAYEYDSLGRLARVDERDSAGVCLRQRFTYDASYNRTRADTVASTANDDCGLGAATSRTWTHDTADRVTTAGWVHDAFGRATSVPAPDSGGRGALSAGYYADDLVRQLSLDGRTHTYDRDPLGRTSTVTSTGGPQLAVRTTNRYADSSDTPVVTTRSDGTAVRELTGPSGELLATKDGPRLTYHLTDINGSIVATVPAGDPDARPAAQTNYDPFGKVTTPTPNVIDWTAATPGYGWLGGHQRSTEFEQFEGSGSPMEMGVRVYLPAVGRFLQVDPVDGGSANPYDYALQDPPNMADLGGDRAAKKRCTSRPGAVAAKSGRAFCTRYCRSYATQKAFHACSIGVTGLSILQGFTFSLCMRIHYTAYFRTCMRDCVHRG